MHRRPRILAVFRRRGPRSAQWPHRAWCLAGSGRWVGGLGVLLALAVGAAHGEPALEEHFESGPLRWQPVQQDDQAEVRVAAHERTYVDDTQRPHSQAERLVVELPGGSSMEWEYPLGHAPVLDELRATLWVRANRPGITLAARAVLPRTVDPDSGEYRTVLVHGTSYETTGSWQRLELAQIPTLVKRQARVLRLETESPIDDREAYVESLVLVVPGGPGGTDVLIDDLELEGVLLATEPSVFADDRTAAGDATPPPTGVVRVGWEDEAQAPRAPAHRLPSRVEVRSSVLQIDGRPFFPRVVSYQGEPLEKLAELGFNTVKWSALPTTEQQQQAEQHQLWQLCTPPTAEELANKSVAPATTYRRVLGWYLDAKAAALPPGQLEVWLEAIRDWDYELNRPVFMPAGTDLHHRVDVVVIGRGVWGDYERLRNHGQWLSEQVMLTGPGLPTFVSIDLAPAGLAREQAAAFVNLPPGEASVVGVSEGHIERLVRIAMSNGCRGLVVNAVEPLGGDDPHTRRRANALALANLQLALLEPWLVGGKVIGVATSSNPALSAVVLQVEQARVVIPLEWSEIEGTTATALTVPGVPESNHAYLLTPASITPLDQRRVAGGVRVVFDPASEGFVVLTEDPRVVASLREHVARIGGRAAQLRRDIAAGRLESARPHVAGSSSQGSVPLQLLSRAGAHLGESDRQLRAGNAAAAYVHAVRGARLTGEPLLRSLLPNSNSALLTSYPLRPSLDALVAYRQMQQSLSTRQPGENRLYGGDFEDVHRLVEFGWKQVRRAPAGVAVHVELSNLAPHHGSYCLRMSSQAADAQQQPSAMNEPAIEIHSPPIPVQQGEVLEIIGWLRIDEPLAADADGLQIMDSLGGPELAVSAQQTTGWQPFRMIRYANAPGQLQLHFKHHGVGTADVDAVMVRPLASAPAVPAASAAAAATVVPQVHATQPRRLFAQPEPR